MIVHFGFVITYLIEWWRSDLYYFQLAWQEPLQFPIAVLFPGTVFFAYAAAHAFLWARFFSDAFGRQRKLGVSADAT
jgi:hypothetical protein